MGHFRMPFQKEQNVTPKERGRRIGAKILFFIILAILLFIIFSGAIDFFK
jgi:predicted nucleic acid-binding Zn ribbon protein